MHMSGAGREMFRETVVAHPYSQETKSEIAAVAESARAEVCRNQPSYSPIASPLDHTRTKSLHQAWL